MDFSNIFGIKGLTLQGITGTGLFMLLFPFVAQQLWTWVNFSKGDRLAAREGFQKQVAALWDENRKLKADADAALLRVTDSEAKTDARLRLCHHETDQLRRQVMALEDEVHGYKRQLDQIGASAMRIAADGNIPVVNNIRPTKTDGGAK